MQACSLNGSLAVNGYAFIRFATIRDNKDKIAWIKKDTEFFRDWHILLCVDAGN